MPHAKRAPSSTRSLLTNVIIFSLRLFVFVETIGHGDSKSIQDNKVGAMSLNSSYTVHPIEAEDVDDVMILLKKTFFLDEPLNQAVGLCSLDEPCPDVAEYCRHSLPEGLSFKAVDCQGNIVGVLINGICPLKEDDNGNDLISQAKRCKNPKFQKILYILARREEGSRLWERFPKDQHLIEVKVAATDPQWRKRGIMNALLERTEQLTREKRIRLLRIDTSSAYSAKSADRLGFTCVYKAKYTDIQMDGRPIIVPEPPHVDDRVYIKELF